MFELVKVQVVDVGTCREVLVTVKDGRLEKVKTSLWAKTELLWNERALCGEESLVAVVGQEADAQRVCRVLTRTGLSPYTMS